MGDTIKVYCKNNKTYKRFAAGTSLLDIYEAMHVRLPGKPACARVNNKTEPLNYICYRSKDVEFAGIDDPSGMRTYVRSLCFVLVKAVRDLFPEGKLQIEHALSRGYYCELELHRALTEEDVSALKQQMQRIIDAGLPFQSVEEQTPEVIRLFRANGLEDKALLLETVGDAYSKYHRLDDCVDYFYGCLLPGTHWIYLFDLVKYNGGLLLRVPNPNAPGELQPYVKQEKMLSVFRFLKQYQKTMNRDNVAALNRDIKEGRISTVVKVAEVLQERRIGKIADEIRRKFDEGVRIILIAGPSSSGKTTFCKRLQIQLLANTLRPVGISLDDYFVNRVDTPLDENGEYDYETIHAIDLPKFNEDLQRIVAGEEVALPAYDFLTGERVYRGHSVRLQENAVLIMEGIHAMNPLLLPSVAPEQTYKVYVSALTSVALDSHNSISTTDNRLIRRIVRDFQFRGYTAKDTLSRWPSVREGEDKWIFPYQENADAMFNSAMLYEFAALRKIAEPILKEVSQGDREFSDAHRLLKFLHYFNYIDKDELPNTSLLREFVGGSLFVY